MTESDKPVPKPSEEHGSASIDPEEAAAALRQVEEAMAVLPKTRFGYLAGCAKYGAVPLVLLAVFVYWNFLRTPPLRISNETTYITQPLTADGTRVDYFAALEQELYPPEMKTDDNGYRLIVRALGASTNAVWEPEEASDREARAAQVYEKLGLDPAVKPTMTFMEPYQFLREYTAREGLDEKVTLELATKLDQPWTLDDLPMMEPWLEQNGPVLDLVGEAVRKPTFCIPMTGAKDATLYADLPFFPEIQTMRSFARMLQARAQYRIATGDIDGAMFDVISCQRLGCHQGSQESLVAILVGIAIRGVATAVGIAAVHESPPSEEQLRHFVAELNAVPVRLDMDRIRRTERYYTLDLLQALAVGQESLAELFSDWEDVGHLQQFRSGIAAYLTVDWNVVMRRINASFDDWENIDHRRPPSLLSPGNLLIGKRSERVGDFLAGYVLPAVQAFREGTRRSDCFGNLQRIALAMLIYERQHGTLPPAYTVDASGQPLHSWRVLLLPYVGEGELFSKLRLDEPWDSPHNRQFHDAAPAVYRCPSTALLPDQTTYSVIVGENSAFPTGQGMPLDQLEMNLILVVERERPVGWMEPTSELSRSMAIQGIDRRHAEQDGIGSPHPGGLNVALRDGSSRFISQTIDLQVWQSLVDGTQDRLQY
jgi:hypothetical protein